MKGPLPLVLREVRLPLLAILLWAMSLACERPVASGPDGATTVIHVTPSVATLRPGESQPFSAQLRDQSGQPVNGSVAWEATGGAIDGQGVYQAGSVPGNYHVVARSTDGVTDTGSVTIEPVQPAGWVITNTGKKYIAENNMVRAEFAYGGPGTDYMFGGGGARSCGLTLFIYKPTSATRNLVFRNGSSGGKYDQAVLMELEGPSLNSGDHNTPDWTDGNDGVTVLPCRISVNPAGQVVVAMTVRLQTLTIAHTTTMDPGGDFTARFDVTVDSAARYEYGALRTLFAAGTYSFSVGATTYSWGTNFRADGETFACATETGTLYREVVKSTANLNTHADYVACMLDDANGNDPDIIWMTQDASASNGTTATVARSICPAGQQYMESALFNPSWAPGRETHADLARFISTWQYPNYGTSACTWPAGLKWTWVERVSFITRRAFTADSLPALWRANVGQ